MLMLSLLDDFRRLLSLKTTQSKKLCWKLRENLAEKRQVVSFPFLPGRSVNSPGKGRLLFIAGSWRFGLAAERGVSAQRRADRPEQGGFQTDQRFVSKGSSVGGSKLLRDQRIFQIHPQKSLSSRIGSQTYRNYTFPSITCKLFCFLRKIYESEMLPL